MTRYRVLFLESFVCRYRLCGKLAPTLERSITGTSEVEMPQGRAYRGICQVALSIEVGRYILRRY